MAADQKNLPRSKEKTSLYETLGIKLFHYHAKRCLKDPVYSKDLSDAEILEHSKKITALSYVTAFIVGALSAAGSAVTELSFPENSCMEVFSYPCFEKYAWVLAITLLLTILEFAVLIWMSIYTVFHLSLLIGHGDQLYPEDTLIHLPNLLSRAALEIPDPVRHILGIDPFQKISKKKLFIIGIFYKLKVILSNILAKLILRRVIGKSALRVGTNFIAVPITGLWNSAVLYKVTREAKLRLFGNLLAKHLAEQITEQSLSCLSPKAKLCCLQSVGNSIVLTQKYHPNMLILMIRLLDVIEYDRSENLDDWDQFVKNFHSLTAAEKRLIMDLLSIAAAFDGKFSKLEKEKLSDIFQEYSESYYDKIRNMTGLMYSGQIHRAKEECNLHLPPEK
ncbi:MAG: hypothetical protein OEZ34_07320 [Spirochaetia bacterium]|nr:hypothetical protein [Spirochaetia bacterium]